MVLCRWWCVDVQKGMMIEQEPLKLPITILKRRRTSADLSAGAPRAKPATQNETEVLRVQHLPRKMRLRCSKCCAFDAKWGWGAPSAAPRHANAASVHSTQSSPDFCGPLWTCSACCTCHTKKDWRASSAAPATQTQPASTVLNPRRTSADLSGGARHAALAAQNETEVLQVLPPATQNETEVLQVLRKRSRCPQYWIVAGLPQTSLEVLHVLHLPRKKETEVLQVLRLPRKMRLTCFKCCACYANVHSNYSILAGLPQTSLEVLHVLHLPQKMRLRCSKCCARQTPPASTVITQSSPDFREPRWRCSTCCTCRAKRRRRCSKCCACHRKWDWRVRLLRKRSRRPQ